VALWSLLGVDVGWRDDFDDAVGAHVGGPLAFVDEVVVEMAEQGCVVEVGGSAF
jgi:hypothetical protein